VKSALKFRRAIPVDNIKLLIFDLDGTLVDSELDLTNSVNAMLREFGRPELPMEVIARYIGDGAPMLVRRTLGDPEDEPYVQRALEFFLRYYREHKLDHTRVYAGVPEALAELRDGGDGSRRMAVLSNKPVNPSRQIVEALGLRQFFFQVYGGNSFPTKKPDPLGAQTLLWESGCGAGEAILIGDTDVDILTARNAGMWSCGVTYGFAPHTLETAPPDVLIDNPSELPLLFRQE
jgi:phosphoglycolate phosphatase